MHTARGGRDSGWGNVYGWEWGLEGIVRVWVAVSKSGVVGGGPALLSMIANVRCCRAIVRVMSIWLWGSGAGGVGLGVLCVGKGESMTMVATR